MRSRTMVVVLAALAVVACGDDDDSAPDAVTGADAAPADAPAPDTVVPDGAAPDAAVADGAAPDAAVADAAVADAAVPDAAPLDAALPDAAPPDAALLDAAPPDAVAADAATRGKITIRADGVTGATGRVVLVGVVNPGGGGFLGAICVPVVTDPQSILAVVRTPAAGNPCDLGAEVVFDNGSYDLMGGVYTPGNTTPDLCSNASVVVAGDTEVAMPAFGACP